MQCLKIYKPNKSVETFRSRSLCCRRSSSDTLFPWKVILMVFDSFPRMPDATNLKVEAGRSQTVTIGIMEAGDKPSSVHGGVVPQTLGEHPVMGQPAQASLNGSEFG